eukprot:813987-Pelagomonas_calceolata.AAC.2
MRATEWRPARKCISRTVWVLVCLTQNLRATGLRHARKHGIPCCFLAAGWRGPGWGHWTLKCGLFAQGVHDPGVLAEAGPLGPPTGRDQRKEGIHACFPRLQAR